MKLVKNNNNNTKAVLHTQDCFPIKTVLLAALYLDVAKDRIRSNCHKRFNTMLLAIL